MNNLYFTIGLSRSGKSTFAAKWQQEKSDVPRVVVCADKIRLTLGNRYNSAVEQYVFAIKHTMIKTLLMDYEVLVDGTHTTKKSIIELLKINIDAWPIFIDTSPEECKKRAIDTKQEDLIPVIDRMYTNIQEELCCGDKINKTNIDKMVYYLVEDVVAERSVV